MPSTPYTRSSQCRSPCWPPSPLQAPVAPFIDYVLAPLAERGYFAGLLCDLPATRHLLYHPRADCV